MEKKKCNRCGESKRIEEFNFKNKRANERQRHCRSCHKDYCRSNYRDNKEKVIERGRQAKIRNRRYVWSYLAIHSCVDCGESDPVVLEFDHTDRTQKIDTITAMAGNGVSIETLKKEIDKCEVRCANCHRRRTAAQLGWYKNIAP